MTNPSFATPDLTEITAIVAPFADGGRGALLPVLHAIHDRWRWCSPQAADVVSRVLGVPLADIHGVLDFYSMFYREAVGERIIRVCGDVPCALAGSDGVMQACSQQLGIAQGETTPDGAYTLERVSCLGLCHAAPAALVNLTPHGHVDATNLSALLANTPEALPAHIYSEARIKLANVGLIEPNDLAAYQQAGGLQPLQQARSMPPEAVVAEIKTAHLIGRGGAAFSTALKWELALRNPAPRYLIVNADESEPGAFKDRVLLENDPLLVLEGTLIACHALGVERAFIYVRGEYALAHARLAQGIAVLREGGHLAGVEIELRRGAGAYICGEETALLESIEGKRGFPRVRPPFPTDVGLWGRPTVINNVETLAAVPSILRDGGAHYAALGTSDSAGTKLFAVSGHVQRPGVYEVAFGVTLKQLIELAGGTTQGHTIRAVLTGGAAGRFVRGDQIDVALDFKALAAVGGTVGAGTLIVLDDTVDLRMVLERIAHFFADESCGKCFPCQLGTQRQLELLHRSGHGATQPNDRTILIELGQAMTDTSLCGLGQTAAMALLSALDHWPNVLHDGGQS